MDGLIVWSGGEYESLSVLQTPLSVSGSSLSDLKEVKNSLKEAWLAAFEGEAQRMKNGLTSTALIFSSMPYFHLFKSSDVAHLKGTIKITLAKCLCPCIILFTRFRGSSPRSLPLSLVVNLSRLAQLSVMTE